MAREVDVPIEVARALDKRYDQHADRWWPLGFGGLLAGIIGTGVALSNHPVPTWSVIAAVVGWLALVTSFVFAIGAGHRDTARVMNHFDRDVQDYDEWADDDDELDDDDDDYADDEGFEYPAITEPTPAPAAPAAPASGGLLSSLRQQGGAQ
ncbi:Uncharacterised protein [Mycobacteroides abscessus subsp. abscessus]|uniref:hypothetical protein n=1 Tax=Mycobacteroides abscessus TaxID=36809 RepID=UPI0005DD13F9|nr:hypothetical protein [Mycobacteroides abscessus]ANO18561.1 hypothetical protein BAB78_08285 [Mycobacteroides abscessus]MDB2220707.1 hypothetical protein [Mycobacteroides abscessus subsp. abscessus]OTR03289.1 hypothetical protein B9M85_08520 [Mycobacteroides abscessus]CPR84225.1 Uncharacterised protein [Mycobacteroides abscessus]SHT04965.1 Uncharacterised protein [Mycobacteroides abscessus subsp. abscessus]